jgi:RimJ/RimL family protein N-acetyltransferase
LDRVANQEQNADYPGLSTRGDAMIRGEKILLRAVRETDLDTLFDFWSDIANRGEYYPLEFLSQAEYKKRYQEHGFLEDTKGSLVICAADQIVGVISFFSAAHYDGFEIGYILFEAASRNKGYVTEALLLLVRHLFSIKKINRLQVTVIRGNEASKRVAEKCGFQFEGVVRGAFFNRGQYHDLELYSLLRAEVNVA